MKYALVAVILTMIFVIQSTFASETALELEQEVFTEVEQTIPTEEGTDISEASSEDEEPSLPIEAPASVAEAPGSLDFDMATIAMIPDAAYAAESEKNHSELAHRR